MRLGGLLGNVMAGIGQGAGKGFAEDGKALREERMREVEMNFRRDMQNDQQEFQSGQTDKTLTAQAEQAQLGRDLTVSEAQKGRDLTVSEAQKGRDLTVSEGAAGRAHSAGLAQMSQEHAAKLAEMSRNQAVDLTQPVVMPDGTMYRATRQADNRVVWDKAKASDGTELRGEDKAQKDRNRDAAASADARVKENRGGSEAENNKLWNDVYTARGGKGGLLPMPDAQQGKDGRGNEAKPTPANRSEAKPSAPPPGAPPKPHPDAQWSPEYGNWFLKGPNGWAEYKADQGPGDAERYGPEVPPAIRKRMLDEAAQQKVIGAAGAIRDSFGRLHEDNGNRPDYSKL